MVRFRSAYWDLILVLGFVAGMLAVCSVDASEVPRPNGQGGKAGAGREMQHLYLARIPEAAGGTVGGPPFTDRAPMVEAVGIRQSRRPR